MAMRAKTGRLSFFVSGNSIRGRTRYARDLRIPSLFFILIKSRHTARPARSQYGRHTWKMSFGTMTHPTPTRPSWRRMPLAFTTTTTK